MVDLDSQNVTDGEVCSATRLSGPPPPANVEMRYSWDGDVTLDWVQVYINIVELLAGFAMENWEEEVEFEEDQLDFYFYLASTTRLLVRQLQHGVEAKYLVWGLYQTGLQIARTYRPAYYPKILAGIVLRNRPIAFFSVEPRRRGLASDSSSSTILLDASHPAINISTLVSRPSVDPRLPSTSSALLADSGTFIDEYDRKSQITYEYDGVELTSSAVFTAYLDALATAAVHDSSETGATVTARSQLRDVSLIVRENQSHRLEWAMLIHALMSVWQRLIVREQFESNPRWEGLTFQIEYDGDLIGNGFLNSAKPSVVLESHG